MQKKIRLHIEKFKVNNREFDDKVLQKNPMDVIDAIYNLRLQFDKDAVSYARRAKINSIKEFRAAIIKDSPGVISALREACKAPDTTALRQAVKDAVQKLTIEYFDLPLEITIITVVHFLSETQGSEFADRRRTMRTLILEAMCTPDWELPEMYKAA